MWFSLGIFESQQNLFVKGGEIISVWSKTISIIEDLVDRKWGDKCYNIYKEIKSEEILFLSKLNHVDELFVLLLLILSSNLTKETNDSAQSNLNSFLNYIHVCFYIKLQIHNI